MDVTQCKECGYIHSVGKCPFFQKGNEWPVNPAESVGKESPTSSSLPITEHAVGTILQGLASLVEALNLNTQSNQALIQALIEQGQMDEEIPQTMYLNGSRIR